MKTLFFFLLPTLAQAALCLDLSGDYFVTARRLPESRHVLTLRQTGCEVIAAGGYTIINGTPAEVSEPKPLYVNEASRAACPACVGFTVEGKTLEIKANGQIEVNKSLCQYNKVRWGLKGRDMMQTYFLTGNSCKKAGSTFTRTFDRYR